MPAPTSADTIRILVATDNHVGAWERDPVRGDDSWKTFHEIMVMAKERDVDMVLLAGDLFHENKPSRKAMYNVMLSLRQNCLGDKPCELEMLSDGSELFDPTFGHANYEDENINVAIPVFSIHGNHDDPAGEGHLAALNILEMSGLVNYFGRTPEGDNIDVKPVLLQKGRTKLALYGLSNVRDERLHRTFKMDKVRFHAPGISAGDFFNILSVHQNHHAYSETNYLPERYLPEMMDLVVWGHEHECDIEPKTNPEMGFKVMQPGSSVATSLIAGEAVPKQVSLLSITGKDFRSESIRLKTVRPFVYKDIVLAEDKEACRIARKDNHRPDLTRHLMAIVEELITQAKQDWREAQDETPVDDSGEPIQPPLPLIRLRVETTHPDGVRRFDVENPQRFSHRFVQRVANTNDVVQFHVRKKASSTSGTTDTKIKVDLKGDYTDSSQVKIDKLVREFLAAQSLSILPTNYFGDAVNQYIDKDDKHAMELFVNESLAKQIKHLLALQDREADDEEAAELLGQIDQYRSQMEDMFAKGDLKLNRGKNRYKPKPDGWDSELDGPWEEAPGALIHVDNDAPSNVASDNEDDEDGTPAPRTAAARGRGRGRGGRARGGTAGTARAATKKPTTASRSRKRQVSDDDDDEEEEEEDVVMIDDDEEEDDSQAMFFKDTSKAKPISAREVRGTASKAATKIKAAPAKPRAPAASPPTRKPPARAAASASKAKQSHLNFTASQQSILGNGSSASGIRRGRAVSDDIEEDEDDAFEPVSTGRARR